eukprot:2483607-Rhodomonas_salina.1
MRPLLAHYQRPLLALSASVTHINKTTHRSVCRATHTPRPLCPPPRSVPPPLPRPPPNRRRLLQ